MHDTSTENDLRSVKTVNWYNYWMPFTLSFASEIFGYVMKCNLMFQHDHLLKITIPWKINMSNTLVNLRWQIVAIIQFFISLFLKLKNPGDAFIKPCSRQWVPYVGIWLNWFGSFRVHSITVTVVLTLKHMRFNNGATAAPF